ncbi:MAG: glycosyltransferase, partial [Bacteroidia bacterium]
ITDKGSLQHFNSIGQLTSSVNRLTYKIINNRFKTTIEGLQVMLQIIFHRIQLIQIPLYNIHYYPLVRSIDKMPALFRPKIVYIVTDSFIPYFYNDDQGRGYNFKTILQGLFDTIKIDAVISWYELFKTFAEKNNIIKSKPRIFCINSRYTGKTFDTTKEKKNHIVFASRLTLAKQPLLFVEAIHILQKKIKLDDWTFFIYGKGHLESEIRDKLQNYGLTSHVILTHKADLTSVFEESKCFVSTQDFENFPSLAMNEAMAAGNAIISRNVGQTHLFVKDGSNGILLKQDNAEGLADALEEFITHPECHQPMGNESIRLTKEVHTFENFKHQMELFWGKTLNKN